MSLATRVVGFGGAAVRIDCTPGRSADLVEFLFTQVPDAADGLVAPGPIVLTESPVDGVFTLSSEGEVCAADRQESVIASWLLHVTCLRLARGGSSGLMFHAGAVSWAGRGLLLPGASGSGKSTITSLLSDRGFEYMTDELVHVSPSSAFIEGLRIPLKIKNRGLSALNGYVALEGRTTTSRAGASEVLVNPDRFPHAAAAVPLSLIVFPRYTPQAGFLLQPVTAAQAGLRLLEGTLNGSALPDHGFRDALRVARLAPAFEMRFADLAQVEANLDVLRRMASS